MKITVKRIAKKPKYTIGKMYLNDRYFCDTIEDTDRGLTSEMSVEEIKSKKVYAQTAIPTGEYDVMITYSPKYQRMMPLICNVKGYEGIRIHSGNTEKDTEGCIIVGKNTVVGAVTSSRDTYRELFNILEHASKVSEPITIKIE